MRGLELERTDQATFGEEVPEEYAMKHGDVWACEWIGNQVRESSGYVGRVSERWRSRGSARGGWTRALSVCACSLCGLLVIGCTNSSTPEAISAGVEGAGIQAASVTVEAKILNGWPNHPALTWQIETGPADEPEVVRVERSVGALSVSDHEVSQILERMQGTPGGRLLSSPSVRISPHQDAKVFVADSVPGGEELSIEIRHAPSNTNPDHFVVSYLRRKGGELRAEIRDAGVTLKPNAPCAIAVGGFKGDARQLLILRREGEACEPQALAIQSARVSWSAEMYRVARNVTPKMIVLGDVPRHDSEGVVAIMASEHFGRLESKIMGFPGSEHVSSPRVLANAGQAATIEIGGMKGATGEAWTKATFLSELGKGHMHKVSLSWSVVGSTAALDYSAWVPEGRTIMLMQPAGERGDGSWHVLVATPRVLRGIDEE